MTLLGEKAMASGEQALVFIDVNAGMNRTGVPIAGLSAFCKEAAAIPGVRIAGLHVYDGNRHEKDLAERLERVQETLLALSAAVGKDAAPMIIYGGSPSFPCYAQQLADAQHSFFAPGTVYIYDIGYREQFPDLPYTPGAAVMARVVSHPAEGYFTLDAGYKAISAEQIVPGVLLGVPPAKAAFQSEEHWTFVMEEGCEAERPAVGEVLYILPWHICPTTAMYDSVFVVSGGRLTDVWEVTARDRLPEAKNGIAVWETY